MRYPRPQTYKQDVGSEQKKNEERGSRRRRMGGWTMMGRRVM
jgi:hypothetical protein